MSYINRFLPKFHLCITFNDILQMLEYGLNLMYGYQYVYQNCYQLSCHDIFQFFVYCSCDLIFLDFNSLYPFLYCMVESFQDYSRIQDFETDFPWKVSLKMLN